MGGWAAAGLLAMVALSGCYVNVGTGNEGPEPGMVVFSSELAPGNAPGPRSKVFDEGEDLVYAFVYFTQLSPRDVFNVTWLWNGEPVMSMEKAASEVAPRGLRELWINFYLTRGEGLPEGQYTFRLRMLEAPAAGGTITLRPSGQVGVPLFSASGAEPTMDSNFVEGIEAIDAHFEARTDGPLSVVLLRGSVEVSREDLPPGPATHQVPLAMPEGFSAATYTLQVIEGDEVLREARFVVEAP